MLSVVIPVHNDADGLQRLLTQIVALDCIDAVIVCDDASDPPCRPADLGFDEAAAGITYLRSDSQRGAGHARNLGLEAVTTDQVLFFDADDLLLPEFERLVQSTRGLEFDFCLFRHVDSRTRRQGHPGPLPDDQARWDRAGVRGPEPVLLDGAGRLILAEIAAYPWNKIYRTAFLRETGIRCTEIPVHNDIELHWASFFLADRIFASAVLGCEHFVAAQGQRLTNRRGRERIAVLQALAPLHRRLPEAPLRDDFLVPFVRFYIRLFGWVEENLDLAHHPEYRRAVAAFLLRVHDEASMTLLANRAPQVARDVVYWIREGQR